MSPDEIQHPNKTNNIQRQTELKNRFDAKGFFPGLANQIAIAVEEKIERPHLPLVIAARIRDAQTRLRLGLPLSRYSLL